ncbi:MAG: hypothetical protein ACOCT9_00345 [archaeon]
MTNGKEKVQAKKEPVNTEEDISKVAAEEQMTKKDYLWFAGAMILGAGLGSSITAAIIKRKQNKNNTQDPRPVDVEEPE